ncbi:stage II sporulation protein M [Nocardia stercoris]|uniref:Stage II sporulation protein M n=1 Tax=Nocardia stercoris TaxID=2483361 RepID=A0A3M2L920_9NOCA|nr:stage II sporulation protein M [Nocardia stercoris]RMI34131.1 stage II sporulation protein M [Nocardia stercoris]
MDVDAYAYAQRRSWDRLAELSGRGRLSGAEADELVTLYRRASQQLARLQSHSPDPELVGGLSALLARARARILRGRIDAWREVGRFWTERFPAELYRARGWWAGVGAAFLTVATGLAVWVANSTDARHLLGLHDDNGDLTGPGGAFETYYSEHPHGAFAAHVWTNNAWVSALALFLGILLLPAVSVLFMNALNVGVSAGLMADAGRLDAFFGFILPHGMLELTAVFVAGGAGLKLGWTLVDPGRQSRGRALARQGRATATIALGLVGVLLVSGLIEGFVTPSGWPTVVRIGIGALAELAFLGYVFVLGGRAARAHDDAGRTVGAESEQSATTRSAG